MASHIDPEAWKRKVRRRWIALITVLVLALLTVLTVYLLRNLILPAVRYGKAERSLESGDLADAVQQFSSLGTYKDARSRAADLAYAQQEDDSLRQLFRNAKTGDVIEFGRYEQDNLMFNGPEPIRWNVVAEDQDMLLLWSESILDHQLYNEKEQDVTWAECTLRTWLNEDFFQAAFTENERLLVPAVKAVNHMNNASGAKGGRDTEDHVCLISYNEILVFTYYNSFAQSYAFTTKYAAAQGVKVHETYGTGSWWLRTPGVSQSCAAYCDMTGSPMHSCTVSNAGLGVRPMIWVLLDKD